jgi:hypothetical protein
VGEPLYVEAAWSFFMDQPHQGHDFYGADYTLEQMAELSYHQNTRGQLYEEYLPAHLLKLLQHRDIFSPPLPYQSWAEYLPENGRRMVLGSREYELSDFLENPKATYYRPTDQAGPDLVGLFSPSHQIPVRYVLFLQAKLRKKMDAGELSKAVKTISPQNFFTVRDTGATLSGYEGHKARALRALQGYQGIIQVLVAFPLDIQDKVETPKDIQHFAIIDSTNADLLFTATIQQMLREVVLGQVKRKRQ